MSKPRFLGKADASMNVAAEEFEKIAFCPANK
jgi:hypothetical protein